MDDVLKMLAGAKNPMEKDIASYIKPRITEESARNIKNKNLTLEGCWDFCMEKGKKYEVKSGNKGVAIVSDEQHHKWVCEYFGIVFPKDGGAAPVPTPPQEAENKPSLNLDFDELF